LSLNISNYLRNIGADPLPTNIPSEEISPDFSVGVKSADAEHLADIQIPETTSAEVTFRFFIDGVQRTVPICLVPVGNLRVPVFIAHLIAGAMERINGRLSPFLRREAIILYFPLEGLRAAGATLDNPPISIKFNRNGNIYELIRSYSQERQLNFWTDISIKLSNRAGEESNLDPSKLSAIGAVRRAARDRSQVLLRILELGIVWEIVNSDILSEQEFIILDGPVFLPFKYATLASRQLITAMDESGERIANINQMYELLSHLIGVVKTVQVIPAQGLAPALSPGPGLTIPIYSFFTTVEGADDVVSRHTLACFTWLRRELSREISPVWSPASELTRVDIPFPAIVDPSDNWYTVDFRPNLQPGSNHRSRLEAILRTVITERWPIPESTPHRMLTELYAIAETERWLRSHLLPEQELRQLSGI